MGGGDFVTPEASKHIEAANTGNPTRQSAEPFRDRDRDRGDGFLISASREILASVNSIVGLADITVETEALSSKAVENLAAIRKVGTNLVGIVNNILDLHNINTGKMAVIPHEYNLADLVRAVLALNSALRGGLGFRIAADVNLPERLIGDDLKLKLILSKMLRNAFKYTSLGSVTWRLSFETLSENDVLLVSKITDTGTGMRPDEAASLFSETGHRTKGDGFGMLLVKRMAEMMGGTVSVSSRYGRGSTFTLSVPQGIVSRDKLGREQAEKLNEEAERVRVQIHAGKEPRFRMPYARVLLVDDSRADLDALREMLKSYEIEVDCLESGEEAVWATKSGAVRYDAIFMDHVMPGMDGIDAVRTIRDEVGTAYARSIPIIAMTTNPTGAREIFLSRGFNDFLLKPFDASRLADALDRWVRDAEREKAILDAAEMPVPPIDGVDVKSVLAIFGGNVGAVEDALRSYVSHAKFLLNGLSQTESELVAYQAIMRGIGVSSRCICAAVIAEEADAMEKAARSGNAAFIKERHTWFVKSVESLINRIEDAVCVLASAGKDAQDGVEVVKPADLAPQGGRAATSQDA